MTELVELGDSLQVYTQSAIEAEYMYDEIFRQGCYDDLDLGDAPTVSDAGGAAHPPRGSRSRRPRRPVGASLRIPRGNGFKVDPQRAPLTEEEDRYYMGHAVRG